MPRISVEGTIGLVLEVVLGILDHLHVREPIIVWGLFAVGLILISDSILRSEWASKAEAKAVRIKRRVFGMIPVVIVFGLFGWWIFGRDRATATAAVSPQSIQHAVPAPQGTPTPAPTTSPSSDRPTAKPAKKPAPPASQNAGGNGNVQVGGGVTAGPCSNVQIGGTGNQATTNCLPPQRHLSSEFIADVSKCLSRRPGTVSILAVVDNVEARTYAQDWYSMFGNAKWKIADNMIGSFMVGGGGGGDLPTGTEVEIRGTLDAATGRATYDPESPQGQFIECIRNRHDMGDQVHLMPWPDMTANEVRVSVDPQPQQKN